VPALDRPVNPAAQRAPTQFWRRRPVHVVLVTIRHIGKLPRRGDLRRRRSGGAARQRDRAEDGKKDAPADHRSAA